MELNPAQDNPDTERERPADAGCPPQSDWPVIASMRQWSDDPADQRWKVIRKCPHCGELSEALEAEPMA